MSDNGVISSDVTADVVSDVAKYVPKFGNTITTPSGTVEAINVIVSALKDPNSNALKSITDPIISGPTDTDIKETEREADVPITTPRHKSCAGCKNGATCSLPVSECGPENKFRKKRIISVSANHWNGNQVCSIDLETTGPDPVIHEIIQIAILPLTAGFEVRKDVIPFYVNIVPENPTIHHDRVSMRKIAEVGSHGFDSEAVKEMLYNWISKLGLPTTKWGTPKQIYPLGHCFSHDKAFMVKWLGYENYAEFFGPRILDTMTTALYINDRAAFHGEQVPFSKVDLSWLAKQYNIDIFGRHDALVDAKITAQVYRKMCQRGIF